MNKYNSMPHFTYLLWSFLHKNDVPVLKISHNNDTSLQMTLNFNARDGECW